MSQERIDQLAERVRNFNIAISGGSDLVGGFGPIPDKNVTLGHLEQAFNDFTLLGHNGLQAAGSIWTGYMLCCDGQAAGGETGGFPVPPPPPPPPTTTGACCHCMGISLQCEQLTESDCLTANGEYEGDDVACPDGCDVGYPCGACCLGATCVYLTESQCLGAGGFYWGDGFSCDDATCPAE